MAVDDINWDESTFIIIGQSAVGFLPNEIAWDAPQRRLSTPMTLLSSTGFVISLSLWLLQIRRRVDSDHG
jgi:hypothetical protein